MDTSYDVRIWQIEVRTSTTRTGGKRKATKYRVAWLVAGRLHREPFTTWALADGFRSKLVTAAREGEAFDTETGRPVSMLDLDVDMNWYDFACEYVDLQWKNAAATTRRSIAEGLCAVTCALLDDVTSAKPRGEDLRPALRRRAFNKKNRDQGIPDDTAKTLDWVRGNCGNVSALQRPDVLRKVMNTLATKIDGTRAAPNYFNRRRGVLRDALKYAVELKIFDSNPLTQTKDAWAKQKKTRTTVDRRCVINPQQAATLLEAVADVPPDITPGQYARLNAPRLKAFFAVMYYAALRPEEAVDLRLDNLDIPAEGWGYLNLQGSAPDAGGDWTDDGERREQRQLKHRGEDEGRTVPCPPQLTALLHQHIQKFGTAKDGRLFRAVWSGDRPDSSVYERAWRKARERVFTPAQIRSPLAARPYDLRHACVSTWLNAGVDPTLVAEWAGHSVKVLLEIYAKCIDGHDTLARARIETALDG